MRQSITVMLSAFSLVVVPCRDALAQDEPIEYGSASDLAGVTRLFVDTGQDMDDRENIIRIVTRELPGVSVVGRARDAEVILFFRSSEATFYAGSYASNRSTTPRRSRPAHGPRPARPPQRHQDIPSPFIRP